MMVRDVVRDCLEKDALERTENDIGKFKNLDFTKGLCKMSIPGCNIRVLQYTYNTFYINFTK